MRNRRSPSVLREVELILAAGEHRHPRELAFRIACEVVEVLLQHFPTAWGRQVRENASLTKLPERVS
jgi:hypothetical protein